MTDTPLQSTDDYVIDPPTDTTTAPIINERWSRWAFRVSQFLVVLPIWVAAYRDGHTGWYPTLDAGMTVLRAGDVFSAHIPLVGMWTTVSVNVGAPTYFPGATELYLLSIPIKLFGNAWGALIGMAVINSAWLLLGGWLLRRRLGTIGATWGLIAFGLLVWTMGSEALIDVAPMQMVTIPFAIFLIAVWSVADRDLGAIWVFALLANYLLLNHLVLTFLVPAIGLVAPVCLIIRLRETRRTDPTSWRLQKSQLIRQIIVGAAITVVLWLPSIIQQFTNSPGNLTNLYNASHANLHRTNTYATALSVIVSMVAIPPFWLRNSYTTALESTQATTLIVFLALALAALWIFSTFRAYQRKDRTTLALLIVAIAAVGAGAINIVNAPNNYGFRPQYFRSLWGTAMLFWLALGVGLVRSWPSRWALRKVLPRRSMAASLAILVILCALAIPHHDPGQDTNGSSDHAVALAKKVMNQAVVRLRHKGQIQVAAGGSFRSYALMSTLVLYLEEYGVDVCVPRDLVAQYGNQRACHKNGPDLYVTVSSAAFPPAPGEQVVLEATLLTRQEQRRKAETTRLVAQWLNEQHTLTASANVMHILEHAYGTKGAEKYFQSQIETNGFGLASLVYAPNFVQFIVTRSVKRADGTIELPIDSGSLPPQVMYDWANLTFREYIGASVRITKTKSAVGR